MAVAQFDTFARNYDTALAQGLAATGEGKEYYARSRARWLSRCLLRTGGEARRVLDFGCGTGSSIPCLIEYLQPEEIVGVDVSEESLAQAAARCAGISVELHTLKSFQPEHEFDLVFCNGVFHHIAPAERADAVAYIRRALRPGGLFAFWENNPWNPGTRYVMSRIPFDRDALPLSPPTARRLLRTGGFAVLRTDFLFIFPRVLRWLRWSEPHVAALPLGGQYQILCASR